MSLGVEFNPEARFEFDEAADWYLAQGGQKLKLEFVNKIEAAIEAVLANPHSFPVVHGSAIRKASVRKFPYIVVFTLQTDRMLIYSVFHTSRNPIVWRGRID